MASQREGQKGVEYHEEAVNMISHTTHHHDIRVLVDSLRKDNAYMPSTMGHIRALYVELTRTAIA